MPSHGTLSFCSGQLEPPRLHRRDGGSPSVGPGFDDGGTSCSAPSHRIWDAGRGVPSIPTPGQSRAGPMPNCYGVGGLVATTSTHQEVALGHDAHQLATVDDG